MSEGHADACRQASDYRLFVLREDQTHGTRAHLPRLAGPIEGIVKGLSDLLPVVRDRLYNPGFGFSKSIKSAAPALCPDVSYDDLDDIVGCASASTAFWQMAGGRGTFRKWLERRSSFRTNSPLKNSENWTA